MKRVVLIAGVAALVFAACSSNPVTPAPQLLRKADADYLIGHPNPPKDFARVPGIQIGEMGVTKCEIIAHHDGLRWDLGCC